MKLTIKTKLIVLLVVPLAGILFLGAQGLLESRHVAHQMNAVEQMSQLAVHVSAMIHETQKERGRTAGFLGSKGTKFKDELAGQRVQANQKIDLFRSYLSGIDTDSLGRGFRFALDAAVSDLDSLDAMRSKITDQHVPLGQALGYYTGMHKKFFNTIAAMTNESSNAAINQRITSYVSFLKSKERAGIERAVLSNTFAQDSFAPGMYAKFVSLVTGQDLYAEEFVLLADTEAASYFEQQMAQPIVVQVNDYRALAHKKATEGGFGVEASVWFDTITKKINLLKDVEDKLSVDLKGAASTAQGQASRALGMYAFVIAVVVVVTTVGGVWVVRSVVKPIGPLVRRAQAITEGDLTGQDLPIVTRDEMGDLTQSINEMLNTLRTVVGQVHTSATEVASASAQIAASSEQVSSGIDEQNQQVTQISSAIEQMSASVVEVARRSGDAASNAAESGRVAQEGGEVVDKTIAGMEAISEAVSAGAASVTELGKRGEQIGQIIEVINDIAEQTNLLALNAAIEAARAGEHGRGFAVVADEVRKLADRTTKATDEIADSIKAIQTETTEAVRRMNAGTQQVQSGVASATQAGESLQQIVDKASEVAGMIQSIAAAAEQQSAASEQVSKSTEAVLAVTRQAGEGTRQAASAATQLSAKSEQLQALVGRFKLDTDHQK